jgi:DNA-binding CsgD family transcriptional regulator
MISEADSKAAAAELEAAALSPREREALLLTCKGLTAKEAAEVMGINFKTVEAHQIHARQKLGMTTIEAVVLAVKAGWV